MAEHDEGRRESPAEELFRQAEQLRGLLEELEKRRAEAESEGLNFIAPTEEQLLKRIRGDHSPSITWQTIPSAAAPGGTAPYNLGIFNPDPINWAWLFVHMFIGPAHLASQMDEAVSAVDTRFPRLTLPAYPGLFLLAGASQTLSFNIRVPRGIEPSNYFGTTFLFQSVWFGPNMNLDRTSFVFEVT
jgi:hypothetical protein